MNLTIKDATMMGVIVFVFRLIAYVIVNKSMWTLVSFISLFGETMLLLWASYLILKVYYTIKERKGF